MPQNWVVVPTCPPVILRRCHTCGAGRFRATGTFRVNANHKLLDAWLLALCTGCGATARLTVLERVRVRSVPPGLLDRLQHNDPRLVAEVLADPLVCRRHRIGLDWDGAWRLEIDGPAPPPDEALDVSVHFAARIPLRPVRLISEALGVPRAEIERLIVAGKLVSATRLTGRLAGDFTFTLKR